MWSLILEDSLDCGNWWILKVHRSETNIWFCALDQSRLIRLEISLITLLVSKMKAIRNGTLSNETTKNNGDIVFQVNVTALKNRLRVLIAM